MILSILATVAVLAAIATIAAALLLAETTLVYIALGLGGISVLLLSAALVQGGVRAAGQDRTRTGTDGLGKSSVPAVATTAATPPGTHGEPEDSGRVPAPAPEPVRDSVVSEHGSTGFPPVTGHWPEPVTGSPDPDPDRSYGHLPAEEARPATEPEPFDHRIPHQDRPEDPSWAVTDHGSDMAPEPAPEEPEPLSAWAASRAGEPDAADEAAENGERALPAPAEDTEQEGTDTVAPTSGSSDEVEDAAEENAVDAFEAHTPSTATQAQAEESPAEEADDDTDEAPTFNYRVPTAHAFDDAGPDADGTTDETRDEPDHARETPTADTGDEDTELDAYEDTHRADPPVEFDGDRADGDMESAADEFAESDTGEGAFSYRVPTAGAVEPAGSGADATPDVPDQGPDTDAHERTDPAEASDADEAVENGTVRETDPETVPEAETDPETVAESEPEPESETQTGADAGDRAAFSYRVPSTDTDEAPGPHAGEAAAFTYRAPAAESEEDPAVAYAALLDADDEPASADSSSRRQDPDQVS